VFNDNSSANQPMSAGTCDDPVNVAPSPPRSSKGQGPQQKRAFKHEHANCFSQLPNPSTNSKNAKTPWI
jgi:hypothetical protein